MIEKMKALLKTKDVCVMATVIGDVPHCSLMSYATDDEGREVYMVTGRETKKYRNLLHNPAVSLLIDTREDDRGDRRARAQALTVNGRAETVREVEKRADIRRRLLARHPHLQTLLDNPEAELIAVHIGSFQLLEGIAAASYISIE